MNPTINGLKYLLSNKKKLIYSTFDLNDYTRVAAQLQAEGVPFRTASYSLPGRTGEAYQDRGIQYKVYVKKEDGQRAQKAVHQKKD